MKNKNYWEECIATSFYENGIKATDEQIKRVALDVEVNHEKYGMAHGYDCIPNPLKTENDYLKRQLEKEKNKQFCSYCEGKGYVNSSWGSSGRSSTSRCYKCNGDGKI